MEVDLARIIALLRREYLFQSLEPGQLAHIATSFECIERPKDTVLFSEGDVSDYFYIIVDGKLRLTRKERSGVRELNIMGPGDFLGEQGLLFDDRRTATATANSSIVLLRLDQQKFRQLLDQYPQIKLNLSATAEGRKLVRRLKFSWLDPEEVIYYICRKHKIFLFLTLGPALATAVVTFVLLTGFLITGEPLIQGIGAVIAAIILAIALGWGIWYWIDWSNDYYIVTNRRVIWQEKIIIFYDSRREAPLNTVMAVNVISSWLGRIFQFGNVDVRTYTGSILMRNMNQPYRFASFVEGYKKRIQAISREQEVYQMEEALEAALHKSLDPPEVKRLRATPPSDTTAASKAAAKKAGSEQWKAFWKTFLKVRYEEGKTITYRKHWWLLLSKASAPFFTLLGSIAIVAWWIIIGQPVIAVASSLLVLALLIWLIYEYMDWSNDIYRLTPDQILDIEKKPLGREQKKTASLDAPDFRVEHTRESLLNIILNFGNVTVNVGQTQFLFRGVYNPDQVHQDVSDHREALMRKKSEDDARRDRDRMVNWLVFYYNQTEKLEKQQEIVLTLTSGVTMMLERVPAGTFLMGATLEQIQALRVAGWDQNTLDTEQPHHMVDLSEYWIAKTPVTVVQFETFVNKTGYMTRAEKEGMGYLWKGNKQEWLKGANWRRPYGSTRNIGARFNHPVTQVAFEDIQNFCDWVQKVSGHTLRLPTEAEWEKAARWTDGRVYPWGEQSPDAKHCNFSPHVDDTTPVGQYSPLGDSPFGCVDMAGNVWELCQDWYDPKAYTKRTGETVHDPQGPPNGQFRVVRGGSWSTDIHHVRAACRKSDLGFWDATIGFRLVRPL